MSGPLINTALIAQRRTELNMSERTLIQAASTRHRVIVRIGPGSTGHASVTLGELSRLAATLALSLADLVTPSDTNPAGPPTDDVATLLASLMDDAKVTLAHRDDLARALGWSLERTEEAARQAGELLAPLGLKLHRHPAGGLAIRSKHGVLSTEEKQRLARMKTARATMPRDQARALREVALGSFGADRARSLSRNQRATIQALRKRGLIADTTRGLQLTAIAAYSLLLTDQPPTEESW